MSVELGGLVVEMWSRRSQAMLKYIQLSKVTQLHLWEEKSMTLASESPL